MSWLFWGCLVWAVAVTAVPAVAPPSVLVYGATGGGFVAALAAARNGARTTLLAMRQHIGGMVTGGLQHTDSANATVLGGITLEFFHRVERQYPGRPIDPDYPPGHSPPGWLFEAHVAEDVMIAMLAEANVTVRRHCTGLAAVDKEDTRLHSISTLDGSRFYADVFIDASYEGDLLAMAGASMTWGREATSTYNESNAGRQLGTQPFGVAVSPFWNASASDPIPIPHVSALTPVLPGEGDAWIQTYTYRLCMTNSKLHRIPLSQPISYNESEWELWRRLYKLKPPSSLAAAGMNCLGPIPNNYSDCVNGSCHKCDMIGNTDNPGTDMVGASRTYPNASVEERVVLARAHTDYIQGLLWFWATDPSVPAHVRTEMNSYGYCADEWPDTDPPYWPHQLYIREARRLVGDWVFTQNEPATVYNARSIGLGSYQFDCHQVSRVIHATGDPTDAYVVDEGRVEAPGHGIIQPTYRIPYDVMLPKRAELGNVLAAVGVSASHVRFNSIRMEPTWMVIGQAAGVAAVLAAQGDLDGAAVQDVDVAKLQATLQQQGQLIDP